MSVLDRFLRYVVIDTRSDERSTDVSEHPRSARADADPGRGASRDRPRGRHARRARIRDGHHSCDRDARRSGHRVRGPRGHVAGDVRERTSVPLVHPSYDGRDLVLPDDPSAVLRRERDPRARRAAWQRHRDGVGPDAPRRGRQGRRRGDRHGGGVSDPAPGDSARAHPHRVHPGRGDRPRRRSLRRDAIRRGVRVHARRRIARRAGIRELLRRRDDPDLRWLQHPSRLRQRPDDQRHPAGVAASSIGCPRPACHRKRRRGTKASFIRISWRRRSIAPG